MCDEAERRKTEAEAAKLERERLRALFLELESFDIWDGNGTGVERSAVVSLLDEPAAEPAP